MRQAEIIDESANRLLTDMGPVYYETDLDHLGHPVVEPFNAYSSLAMALTAVLIWIFLLRNNFRSSPFLAFVFAPLLFLGGIGSTLFHAFRSSQFFLLLDWLPILFLTILLSLHYWYKLFPRWLFIFGMTLLIILARGIPAIWLRGSLAINVSYFLSGVLILIPLFVYMYRNRFRQGKYILYSVIVLLLALIFRYTDDFDRLMLPMGTHWLWHIFSAWGAWLLGVYIYKSNRKSVQGDIQVAA
ncbi:MAG: hypothetical protein P8100_02330 [bacterium]